MKHTSTELHAAHLLGEAILGFCLAIEDRLVRPDKEPAVPVHPDRSLAVSQARDQDRLLTTSEVAELLRVSDRTIYSMTCPRGPIQSVRLGAAVRYVLKDVREAIEGMKT